MPTFLSGLGVSGKLERPKGDQCRDPLAHKMAEKNKVLWSASALSDIREIRENLGQEDPEAAKRLASLIGHKVQSAAEPPSPDGTTSASEDRGYQEVMMGPFRIVYGVQKGRVAIFRVWDDGPAEV